VNITSRYLRQAGFFAILAYAIAATLRPGTIQGADPDLDLQAVQKVCGRCHTITVFQNKPRSWDRWNDVFADMTQRGANGTDEELERVTRYFWENLTVVNVNTSPAEELIWVLGIREETAEAIIARRERRPFSNLAELSAVPGVNAKILEQRKSRILF
jgi:competence ComEA-like helix-hairpin-helix protein